VGRGLSDAVGRIWQVLCGAIYIPQQMVLQPVDLTAPVTVPVRVPGCIRCGAKAVRAAEGLQSVSGPVVGPFWLRFGQEGAGPVK